MSVVPLRERVQTLTVRKSARIRFDLDEFLSRSLSIEAEHNDYKSYDEPVQWNALTCCVFGCSLP